jgi:large subunit ribosomal protein L18
MNRLDLAKKQAKRRAIRVRKVINGTAQRPRLSVKISNLHVVAQLIDDDSHKTVAHSTTAGHKDTGKTMTDKAVWVGKDIAKKAKAAKIKQVAFDRGSKLYHGRVKALADAARDEGLEF